MMVSSCSSQYKLQEAMIDVICFVSVPPIFLAAFAMQESSCKADVKGDNGGAWGLMQITQDKCGGAPGGNCVSDLHRVTATFASSD